MNGFQTVNLRWSFTCSNSAGGRSGKRSAAFDTKVGGPRGGNDEEHSDEGDKAEEDFLYQFHRSVRLLGLLMMV